MNWKRTNLTLCTHTLEQRAGKGKRWFNLLSGLLHLSLFIVLNAIIFRYGLFAIMSNVVLRRNNEFCKMFFIQFPRWDTNKCWTSSVGLHPCLHCPAWVATVETSPIIIIIIIYTCNKNGLHHHLSSTTTLSCNLDCMIWWTVKHKRYSCTTEHYIHDTSRNWIKMMAHRPTEEWTELNLLMIIFGQCVLKGFSRFMHELRYWWFYCWSVYTLFSFLHTRLRDWYESKVLNVVMLFIESI